MRASERTSLRVEAADTTPRQLDQLSLFADPWSTASAPRSPECRPATNQMVSVPISGRMKDIPTNSKERNDEFGAAGQDEALRREEHSENQADKAAVVGKVEHRMQGAGSVTDAADRKVSSGATQHAEHQEPIRRAISGVQQLARVRVKADAPDCCEPLFLGDLTSIHEHGLSGLLTKDERRLGDQRD